ncbi:MAG: N-acetyl-gamma-glutamyl-phosphate reductase [Planctomycetota bacterium]
MAIKVSILGATGYTGLEALRILARHAEARVVSLPSRREEGQPISAVHPELEGRCELTFSALDPERIASECDVAISCLPHGVSLDYCAALRKRGVRVIDVSADYRLKDPGEYEKWYGHAHTDIEGLAEAVYGLPELFADEIRKARIVANPGCYPTATILALAPLLQKGIVAREGIIADAKSGVSGAGRKLSEETHFPEANENLTPYAVGTHRHSPEIVSVLSRIAGRPVDLLFVPHLAPMTRGILATCYATTTRTTSDKELEALYRKFYAGARFVRVLAAGTFPSTRRVANTNLAEVSARACGNWIVAMSAIDNLVKGASGQAVQNMNLMFALDEGMGLDTL